MKTKIRRGSWAVWGAALALLMLDGDTALSGCRAGAELCVQSVIPALFPFLVLSPLFTQAMCSRKWKALTPLTRLLRIPQGSETLLLTGCLGGYPVGAQTIAAAWEQGRLESAQARRMLGFCCNCGPGFIFGICAGSFSSSAAPWLLWLSHLAGAFAVGYLLPDAPQSRKTGPFQPRPVAVTQALSQAVKTMAQICGWVVIFRLVLAFGETYLLGWLPPAGRVLMGGLLELTGGCCGLGRIPGEGFRLLVCQLMLGFGGVCVAMQTASVTGRLGLGWYLPGKGFQALLSGLFTLGLCCLACGEFAWAAASLGLFLAIPGAARLLLEKSKKIGGNPRLMGV